jgi:acetyl esterase/lipase
MPVLQAECEYKQAEQCSIRADVFLPTQAHPPVVVYVHGGALISGSRRRLAGWQRERLRKAGFAFVPIDYRLAPETQLPEIVQDVQDAITWVKGEGAATFGWDANRVAVMGGSAGGYLSLLSGTFEVKPQAVVSFYGYGDILGDWYTQPSPFYCGWAPISREEAESAVGGAAKSSGGRKRYTYYFYLRQQGIWPEAVSGWRLPEERERFLRYCPAANVSPAYPPALLLHGDQDTDVPYEQSLEMARALERGGIQHELVTVQGAGHGFDDDGRDPEVRRVFERVAGFLEERLKS